MSLFTAGLPSFLLQSLRRMKIETPTNIQSQAIPTILEGKDALITAHTGSGKTLAYLVPIIMRIAHGCNRKVLILAPTRELATQISTVAISCLADSDIKVANLIGGQSIVVQLKQLRKNPQIIIGTPGRVYDHIERGSVELSDVSCFVLDEMDRMLDLGFNEQIQEIEKFLTKERQTLMFSATLPPKTMRSAERYLVDHVRICDGQINKPAPKIDHSFEKVSSQDKYQKMLDQITQREGTVIIFVNRKVDAQKIAGRLKDDGIKADSIHGDLRQNVRDRILQKFRDQKIRIMVGTDVVARGLDVKHIQHVINYDLPMCPEDYLHRIGRTGRAGETGSAFSLVGPQDSIKWRAIQRLIDPSLANKDQGKERDFKRQNSRSGSVFGSKKRDNGGGFGRKSGNGHSRQGSSFGKDNRRNRSNDYVTNFDDQTLFDRPSRGRNFGNFEDSKPRHFNNDRGPRRFENGDSFERFDDAKPYRSEGRREFTEGRREFNRFGRSENDRSQGFKRSNKGGKFKSHGSSFAKPGAKPHKKLFISSLDK